MKKKIIPVSFIILLSIILWASVSLSGDYVYTIKVPIQITNMPNGYALGHISSKEVYIRVKGKGWELARVDLAGGEEFLVSANKKIGKFRTSLRNHIENNGWLTSAFQVVDISPTSVEYDIDKVISKTVHIKQNIQIEFKKDFGFASLITVSPDVIEVSGPESILRNIDTLRTDSLHLRNVSEKTILEISLEQIEGLTYSQDKCSLEFDVQKIVDKSFDDLVVEIRNVPLSKELNLFPSRISVVLRGGINTLGRLTNDSIKAYVDFWSVLRSEDDAVEPTVEIPSFTNLVDIKPRKVEYVIKQY